MTDDDQTTYLERLLSKDGPLEPDEISNVRDWLRVLKEDCALFGTTPDDSRRIAACRAKIAASEVQA